MERTGILTKASEEIAKSGKEVFKIAVRDGDKDWEYTLFDTAHIAIAKENKGKSVKIEAEKGEAGYWNIKTIEPAEERKIEPKQNGKSYGRSPEERKEIATQVAVKSVTDLWIAGKLADGTPEVVALRAWLCERLGTKRAEPIICKKDHPNKEETADNPQSRLAEFVIQMRRLGRENEAIQAWLWNIDKFKNRKWQELSADEQYEVIKLATADADVIEKHKKGRQ